MLRTVRANVLVHGFCFGLIREVMNRVGLFYEDSFPNGYGEENDYCFRAADAGFSLVIATHTYFTPSQRATPTLSAWRS